MRILIWSKVLKMIVCGLLIPFSALGISSDVICEVTVVDVM